MPHPPRTHEPRGHGPSNASNNTIINTNNIINTNKHRRQKHGIHRHGPRASKQAAMRLHDPPGRTGAPLPLPTRSGGGYRQWPTTIPRKP
mmetsp:Transcript_46194/g.115862  ORF Transcript_46194/g.115862 Transcript_46194/m.115862 type:complete len:90 (-) Transcript_46194:774-1043(-)